uniref:Solute carrier family 12 member 2 n=1 Tax=Plectus sambesii TaxID=2011161 RepID=A0A914X1N1_9BILA
MPSDFQVYTVDNAAQGFESTADDSSLKLRCETLEKPPNIDHYRKTIVHNVRMSTRPSIDDLLSGISQPGTLHKSEDKEHKTHVTVNGLGRQKGGAAGAGGPPPSTAARLKLGWIQGVFVRCMLNILGVMLYLRMSWMAGQAGLLFGTLIVILACTVTTLTAISMCTICTNGDVKGGGLYFLVSRSLGPEFGGSIGVIFSIANAVGAAMYIVGFAETVADLMKEHNVAIFDNGINDVRVIGLATCVLLMGIVFIGTGFESKMQMVLLVILTLSLINFVIGTFLPISKDQNLRGITGYSWTTLTANLMPAWRGESFFSVFGVFFPAATGIMAGANISGDLRDAQSGIPKGTLLAILVTTIIYLATVWITGGTTVRDADGFQALMYSNSSNTYITPPCASNETCAYGLMNYFQVMELESGWGPLITAGIFAATLSSALASLVSAPKIFQAVCRDRIFPYVSFFTKGYGKNDEPRRAYGLTFILAMLIILIGDLNVIAPIISNFFLAAYALINYACFDGSFSLTPGFRPTFKYYNKWVALLAALLCLVIMFVISWWTALITFLFFLLLFYYIHRRRPDANWGSSTQANAYKNAFTGILKLTKTEEHVKNYRPQFLVMTGNPASRRPLLDFASSITKGHSLIVCGHVLPHEVSLDVLKYMKKLDSRLNTWLLCSQKLKAFYSPVANTNIRHGTQALLQAAGMGKLRPNILLLGFKSNWKDDGPDGVQEIDDYVGLIRDAFDSGMGVGILRNGDQGLDHSHLLTRNRQLNETRTNDNVSLPSVSELSNTGTHRRQMSSSSAPFNKILRLNDIDIEKDSMRTTDSISRGSINCAFHLGEEDTETIDMDVNMEENTRLRSEFANVISMEYAVANAVSAQETSSTGTRIDLFPSMNRFRKKEKKAVIDVWWLYDDGGLTLLVPYLLSLQKSYLEGADLRVFTIASSPDVLEQEQRSMAVLLSKFRIKCTEIFVVPDIEKEPSSTTVNEFEELIAPFRTSESDPDSKLITEEVLKAQANRTKRQLRCRELLQHHSANAQLIILTLPVPRKRMFSSSLYMAWLDMLTRGMPPTLLIRGNQTSVLTFYS